MTTLSAEQRAMREEVALLYTRLDAIRSKDDVEYTDGLEEEMVLDRIMFLRGKCND